MNFVPIQLLPTTFYLPSKIFDLIHRLSTFYHPQPSIYNPISTIYYPLSTIDHPPPTAKYNIEKNYQKYYFKKVIKILKNKIQFSNLLDANINKKFVKEARVWDKSEKSTYFWKYSFLFFTVHKNKAR